MPSRDAAPFVYDVGYRVGKGALLGFLVGMAFFKKSSSRKFFTYYGAGFGLGMSYTQINYLQQKLRGIELNNEENVKRELEDLKKELELRSKLQI
eukprot:403342101